MSIHVCKCIHSGREEYHLRYPGMTEAAAQELADEINGGALSYAKRYKEEQARRRAEVGAGETAVESALERDIHAELTLAAFLREVAK